MQGDPSRLSLLLLPSSRAPAVWAGRLASPRSAARLFLGPLLSRLRHYDGLALARSLCRRRVVRFQGLLAHYLVNLRENVLKGFFYVGGVERACLDEAEGLVLAKRLCVLRLDTPQVPQIALVAHEHDHYVAIGVVSELLQPPPNVVKSGLLRDVVNKESPNSAPVVRARDRPVPLLAGSVPDLKLDLLAIKLNCSDLEINPYKN